MKALILCGGWEGHAPLKFAEWAQALLEAEGASVQLAETLDVLTDSATMGAADLIVPIWSSMGSGHLAKYGNMVWEQEQGLLNAVRAGAGIAGWHGHMADAFRDRPNYHFMVGGQFVAHPPAWPDDPNPRVGFVDYQVNITRTDDPITQGIPDFTVHSEQYYMHVDPSNEVLATTTFSGEHLPWIAGTVMPVVWKRRWGEGRVFYCSIGHELEELNIPEVRTIVQRGLLWAARPSG